jgi:transcriptional regulator with XRE-family HTH domain
MDGDQGGSLNGRGNPDLGDFLRTRRARLDPEQVGITPGPRRRAEGLRRREVAELAGVSPDYYTRLEQGRHRTASAAVLDALARALRISGEDRAYLYNLAQVVDPYLPEVISEPVDADHPLRGMVENFGSTPAVLCGPFSEILAANDAATFLWDTDFMVLPPEERNSVHFMVTSPAARALYDDAWEQAATEIIGRLRAEIALRPHSSRGRALVARLERQSELFRAVWKRHDVAPCAQGVRTLRHRIAGTIRMRDEALTIPASPDHFFYLMVPADGAFASAFQARG